MSDGQKLLKSPIKIIGASATGPLHLAKATPCQDAFADLVLPNGIAVISIADGLGSALFSDFGAKVAVDTAVSTVKHILSNDASEEPDLINIINEAILSSRKALEEKAIIYQCELRELACTLIVVILNKDCAVVAHIGDGAVIAKTSEGLRLISNPADSEYVNEVVPITSPKWRKSLRISPVISGISGIIAFTDGLQRAALKKTSDGYIPFDGFCEPLFQYASEVSDLKEAENNIKALLMSKKLCNNSEDDKTLVISIYKGDVLNGALNR